MQFRQIPQIFHSPCVANHALTLPTRSLVEAIEQIVNRARKKIRA